MIDSMYGEGKKKLCPYCIEEFFPGDCRIVSGVNGIVLKEAPKGLIERQLARRNPEPLIGPKYARELAGRECPRCKNLLPYNIENVDSKIVVVVGDTYSGKSHFLAALIRQIQAGQVRNPNQYARFFCLTQSVLDDYTKDYLNLLFKNKEILVGTQPGFTGQQNKPLIFELIVRKSEANPPRRINLVLYDASGEDYALQERMVLYSRYVLNASAIIFLADPVSMPDIFNQLPSQLQNQPSTGRIASNVLSSTIHMLERDRGFQSGSRLNKIPFAITLSKSDLLKNLRPISKRYHFMSNPRYGYDGGVDLQDLQVIDAEVRQLIDEFGDKMLLHATQSLNAQFFAVSATGNPPKTDGTYAAVEPIRCLDPVLWVLHKLRIIEAR